MKLWHATRCKSDTSAEIKADVGWKQDKPACPRLHRAAGIRPIDTLVGQK